ncbi:MAG: hypothetical protein ACFE9L_00555 [Candidatus Hodarchaeota archaeon]
MTEVEQLWEDVEKKVKDLEILLLNEGKQRFLLSLPQRILGMMDGCGRNKISTFIILTILDEYTKRKQAAPFSDKSLSLINDIRADFLKLKGSYLK